METAENERLFDGYISQLKEHWQMVQRIRIQFVDFRNKRLAHLEVSKYEDHYGPTEIQPLEWDSAVEALGRLIQVAGLVSAILQNPGRDLDQAQCLAQKDAQDFWQSL
ncbi:MAG: hypothetical protein JO251_11720 [Verrucomicrobia bacterium]|nr:hypothetical protein [Verrucomicrobiota bacterium]